MRQASSSRHTINGAVRGYQTKIHADKNGKTQVIFYQTSVVTFDNQTISLNTGGWRTRSTRARMNQASEEFNLGYRVFQKKGEWFVDYKSNVRPYTEDQMTLNR